MSAVLVLPGTAPESEWLAARRQGVTASEIAGIMGLSSWTSPFKIFHQKLGLLPDDPESDVQVRGKVLEPYVGVEFAKRHPEFYIGGDGRTLYAHPDLPWMMATPDRLLSESECHDCGQPGCAWRDVPVAGLEMKTATRLSDEWGEDGTDHIPVAYRCQVLWNMAVTGLTSWFLACQFMMPWQLRVYELAMDERAELDLKLMTAEAESFLARIKSGDPPDVDWRPATRSALAALHPALKDEHVIIGRGLAIRYRAALKAAEAAEKRKALLTNMVLREMGVARWAVVDRSLVPDRHGVMVPEKLATRSVSEQSRVQVKAVREKYPRIAAECSKTSTITKLIPAGARDADPVSTVTRAKDGRP